MNRRRAEVGLALAALALVAGACSSTPEPAASLSVFGPWLGDEAVAFRSVLDDFERQTGITVQYTGSASFATAMRERLEEGSVPDVAMFPQPGLLQDLADDGYVLPLRSDVQALVASHLLPAVAEIGNTDRGLDGVPYRLNVKSLVWYRPDFFAASGYEVPTTWNELTALTDDIADDGLSPWCLGISAFEATGWPATDWVEDIILRLAGTDDYDAWVAGDIPFTDDLFAAALTDFRDLVLAPSGSLDARRTMFNTTPARAQDPMFDDPPGCVMYKQASFQVANLPPGVEIGPEGGVDVFVLPGADASAAPPLLIGGDVAAALTNRSETWRLLEFLGSPEAGRAWAERGGFISPDADFPADAYDNAFDRRAAELLADADVVRFDGSDMMLSAVGTGTFLDAMALFVATGRIELAQTVAQSGYSENLFG